MAQLTKPGNLGIAERLRPFDIGLLNTLQDRSQASENSNLTVACLSANILDESAAGVLFPHGDPFRDDKDALAGVDSNHRSSNVISDRVVAGSV